MQLGKQPAEPAGVCQIVTRAVGEQVMERAPAWQRLDVQPAAAAVADQRSGRKAISAGSRALQMQQHGGLVRQRRRFAALDEHGPAPDRDDGAPGCRAPPRDRASGHVDDARHHRFYAMPWAR